MDEIPAPQALNETPDSVWGIWLMNETIFLASGSSDQRHIVKVSSVCLPATFNLLVIFYLYQIQCSHFVGIFLHLSTCWSHQCCGCDKVTHYQHARDIASHSHILFFQLFEYEENPQKLRMPDDSDIDDDLSDCYDNDSSEEEGETAVKTLEWDDSTLSY